MDHHSWIFLSVQYCPVKRGIPGVSVPVSCFSLGWSCLMQYTHAYTQECECACMCIYMSECMCARECMNACMRMCACEEKEQGENEREREEVVLCLYWPKYHCRTQRTRSVNNRLARNCTSRVTPKSFCTPLDADKSLQTR